MWYQIINNTAEAARSAGSLIESVRIKIIDPIIGLFFMVATVIFLWGVVEMIAGADNEEKRTIGKRHMIWGIIGLFVMVSAGAIISMICQFFGLGASCG